MRGAGDRDRPDCLPRSPRQRRRDGWWAAAEARDGTDEAGAARPDAERRRRRAVFPRESGEGEAPPERVRPRRAGGARARRTLRMRTFRW
ncbi:hypothetical protein E4099_29365 [Streptomyces palmae]|uniref:Uncharacterized protein n=1 Tax=Streptomyces palmae TaxID=1701085 RepID=A0A4Z0G0H2_9ACTN|nr:hypothetical protein E4099_29365 [Streptomyces palmae]